MNASDASQIGDVAVFSEHRVMWTQTAKVYKLRGSYCEDCNTKSFPGNSCCRVCGSAAVVACALAPRGTIETHAPSGEVVVAEIRLDDGVLVMGRVVPPERARTGAMVSFAPNEDFMRFEIDG